MSAGINSSLDMLCDDFDRKGFFQQRIKIISDNRDELLRIMIKFDGEKVEDQGLAKTSYELSKL
jgi:hypothetical protein